MLPPVHNVQYAPFSCGDVVTFVWQGVQDCPEQRRGPGWAELAGIVRGVPHPSPLYPSVPPSPPGISVASIKRVQRSQAFRLRNVSVITRVE